jgi:hypothetical protein
MIISLLIRELYKWSYNNNHFFGLDTSLDLVKPRVEVVFPSNLFIYIDVANVGIYS